MRYSFFAAFLLVVVLQVYGAPGGAGGSHETGDWKREQADARSN